MRKVMWSAFAVLCLLCAEPSPLLAQECDDVCARAHYIVILCQMTPEAGEVACRPKPGKPCPPASAQPTAAEIKACEDCVNSTCGTTEEAAELKVPPPGGDSPDTAKQLVERSYVFSWTAGKNVKQYWLQVIAMSKAGTIQPLWPPSWVSALSTSSAITVPADSQITATLKSKTITGKEITKNYSWQTMAKGSLDFKIMPSIAFTGNVISSFYLSQADPKLCQDQCAGQASCNAFTYWSPGAAGPNAYCELKSAASAPIRDARAISGVVQRGSPRRAPSVSGPSGPLSYLGYLLAFAEIAAYQDDNPNYVVQVVNDAQRYAASVGFPTQDLNNILGQLQAGMEPSQLYQSIANVRTQYGQLLYQSYCNCTNAFAVGYNIGFAEYLSYEDADANAVLQSLGYARQAAPGIGLATDGLDSIVGSLQAGYNTASLYQYIANLRQQYVTQLSNTPCGCQTGANPTSTPPEGQINAYNRMGEAVRVANFELCIRQAAR